jgi:hypothetical protein
MKYARNIKYVVWRFEYNGSIFPSNILWRGAVHLHKWWRMLRMHQSGMNQFTLYGSLFKTL